MQAYIIGGLLLIVPTLFLVSVIIFSVVRFVPGDVIDMMLAETGDQEVSLTVLTLSMPWGWTCQSIPSTDTGWEASFCMATSVSRYGETGP